MSRQDYLGEFEHLVLLAVMRLDGDAYAVTIREEIAAQAARAVSFGAVYSTLRRLHSKVYLEHRDEPVAGGRAKRFFSVTPEGIEAVRRSQERIARMSVGVSQLQDEKPQP